MESFLNHYLDRVHQTKSVLCVGLDPTAKHVPPSFGDGKDLKNLKKYLEVVIDIAEKKVPVVKPQYAYYGAFGPEGIKLLQHVVNYAHKKGLLVILDAKRADIGETMEQYAEEVFGQYGVDACTFVPYLGSTFDPSWLEWLKQGKNAISMVRTSNPEATQLQDLRLKTGELVYERMAKLVKEWDEDTRKKTDNIGGIGAIIGATWPEQAVKCREILGDNVFALIPGYGTQGGGADGAVAGLPNSKGELVGAVNSSRGITLTSWFDKVKNEPKSGDPLKHIEAVIDDANSDLNQALERKLGHDSY